MKTEKIFILSLLFLVGFAATKAQPESTPEVTTIVDVGATIATKGTKSGVAACNSCHGAKGEGIAATGFPRIAGEPGYYLVNQLKDYASGVRDNSMMSPIAKALTEAEKEAVSAYFASLPVPNVNQGKKASKGKIKRGEILATTGDMKLFIQACNNCHGPGGRGVAPAIPSLAAQHPGYLAQQITAWKEGKRTSSPEQMAVIAKKLSDKDISALAAYFESIDLMDGKKK